MIVSDIGEAFSSWNVSSVEYVGEALLNGRLKHYNVRYTMVINDLDYSWNSYFFLLEILFIFVYCIIHLLK